MCGIVQGLAGGPRGSSVHCLHRFTITPRARNFFPPKIWWYKWGVLVLLLIAAVFSSDFLGWPAGRLAGQIVSSSDDEAASNTSVSEAPSWLFKLHLLKNDDDYFVSFSFFSSQPAIVRAGQKKRLVPTQKGRTCPIYMKSRSSSPAHNLFLSPCFLLLLLCFSFVVGNVSLMSLSSSRLLSSLLSSRWPYLAALDL